MNALNDLVQRLGALKADREAYEIAETAKWNEEKRREKEAAHLEAYHQAILADNYCAELKSIFVRICEDPRFEISKILEAPVIFATGFIYRTDSIKTLPWTFQYADVAITHERKFTLYSGGVLCEDLRLKYDTTISGVMSELARQGVPSELILKAGMASLSVLVSEAEKITRFDPVTLSEIRGKMTPEVRNIYDGSCAKKKKIPNDWKCSITSI